MTQKTAGTCSGGFSLCFAKGVGDGRLCLLPGRLADRARFIGFFCDLQGDGDFTFAEVTAAVTMVFAAGVGDIDRHGLII